MVREIKIKAVLNGWIVTVGCQSVVFTQMESMLSSIDQYLSSPIVAEKAWLEKSINAKLTFGEPAQPACAQEQPIPAAPVRFDNLTTAPQTAERLL